MRNITMQIVVSVPDDCTDEQAIEFVNTVCEFGCDMLDDASDELSALAAVVEISKPEVI